MPLGVLTIKLFFAVLEAAGVNQDFIDILKNLSTGASPRLLTVQGLSDEIPISQGMKQDCLFSGPLFNLATDPSSGLYRLYAKLYTA